MATKSFSFSALVDAAVVVGAVVVAAAAGTTGAGASARAGVARVATARHNSVIKRRRSMCGTLRADRPAPPPGLWRRNVADAPRRCHRGSDAPRRSDPRATPRL